MLHDNDNNEDNNKIRLYICLLKGPITLYGLKQVKYILAMSSISQHILYL